MYHTTELCYWVINYRSWIKSVSLHEAIDSNIPGFIPVSAAWDTTWSICTPTGWHASYLPALNLLVLIYASGGEGHNESSLSCPRTQCNEPSQSQLGHYTSTYYMYVAGAKNFWSYCMTRVFQSKRIPDCRLQNLMQSCTSYKSCKLRK